MILKALIESFQNQVSLLDLEQVVKNAVDSQCSTGRSVLVVHGVVIRLITPTHAHTPLRTRPESTYNVRPVRAAAHRRGPPDALFAPAAPSAGPRSPRPTPPYRLTAVPLVACFRRRVPHRGAPAMCAPSRRSAALHLPWRPPRLPNVRPHRLRPPCSWQRVRSRGEGVSRPTCRSPSERYWALPSISGWKCCISLQMRSRSSACVVLAFSKPNENLSSCSGSARPWCSGAMYSE